MIHQKFTKCKGLKTRAGAVKKLERAIIKCCLEYQTFEYVIISTEDGGYLPCILTMDENRQDAILLAHHGIPCR